MMHGQKNIKLCKKLFLAMLIDQQDIQRLVINCMLLKETGY